MTNDALSPARKIEQWDAVVAAIPFEGRRLRLSHRSTNGRACDPVGTM
jgi:hypothetical protein